MLFDKELIRSVLHLLQTLDSRRERARRVPVWYRGLTNSNYKLVPSLGRPPFKLDNERGLLNIFKQNAVQFLDERPQSQWEWLFLARHHNVPTRLLDWTEVPAYRTLFRHSLTGQDGQERQQRRSSLAAFADKAKRGSKHQASRHTGAPVFEDNDEHLQNYLPSKLASEHTSRLIPAAGIAGRHSKRMQAQHSVFTVTHRDQTPIESVGKGLHIGRFIIPSSSKPGIRRQLEALKIDSLSVFPELDNAASLARRRYNG